MLLRNPNLNQELFSESCLFKLKALEHFEIGGTPNRYIADIDYENSISKFVKAQKDHKLSMRVLKFEFCLEFGDSCILELLKCFSETLEEFVVTRNFYYQFSFISDMAFDLNEEFEKIDYDPTYVNDN